MSIAFENSNGGGAGDRYINTMISYRSYEEYLKYKDADIREVAKLMNARTKERIEEALAEKALVQTVNSDKFNKALEETIAKIIQEALSAAGRQGSR